VVSLKPVDLDFWLTPRLLRFLPPPLTSCSFVTFVIQGLRPAQAYENRFAVFRSRRFRRSSRPSACTLSRTPPPTPYVDPISPKVTQDDPWLRHRQRVATFPKIRNATVSRCGSLQSSLFQSPSFCIPSHMSYDDELSARIIIANKVRKLENNFCQASGSG